MLRTAIVRAIPVLPLLLASATAQQFGLDDLRRPIPHDQDMTVAIVAGDLDGDGDPDMAMAHQGILQDVGLIRFYTNIGRGRFLTTQVPPLTLPKPTAMAGGDLDSDGDIDLVVAREYMSALLLNDGAGHFADVQPSHWPQGLSGWWAVALGDVDNDGDLDIAVGGRGSGSIDFLVNLYRNDGSGHFSRSNSLTTTRRATDMAFGDIDGDADLDLVVATGWDNAVFVNDGVGAFVAAVGFGPTRFGYIGGVALGDVDGDGDLDAATAELGTLGLYLNDGSGQFTNRTGTLLPFIQEDPRSVALADMDGDGDLDLLCGNSDWHHTRIRMFVNDGTGRMVEATASWLPTESAWTQVLRPFDADGDGFLDLAVGTMRAQNRLWFNIAGRRLVDPGPDRIPRTTSLTNAVRAIALGDVESDGDVDLLLGCGAAELLFANDGSGRYVERTATHLPVLAQPAQPETQACAMGDVDGDGFLDLVMAGRENKLYVNDGSGRFLERSGWLPPAAGWVEDLVLRDLDGDADSDLYLATAHAQDSLYLNDGSGTFVDVSSSHLPSAINATYAIVAGDVDGDGDVDLLTGHTLGFAQNRLLLNDGTAHFVEAAAGCLPVLQDGTLALALGDLDGDGDADLLVGNSGIGSTLVYQNQLLLNDGNGRFVDATHGRLPVDRDDTWSMALGDVDEDGDLDLFSGHRHGLRLLLNDGSARFREVASRMPHFREDQFVHALSLSDLDGDGDLDLVAIVNNEPVILVNHHRQVSAVFVPSLGSPFEVRFFVQPGYGTDLFVGLPALSLRLSPVPQLLPGFGTLFLPAGGRMTLPWVSVPPHTGVGSLSIMVPNNLALLDSMVHVQALMLTPLSPAAGPRLTSFTTSELFR